MKKGIEDTLFKDKNSIFKLIYTHQAGGSLRARHQANNIDWL